MQIFPCCLIHANIIGQIDHCAHTQKLNFYWLEERIGHSHFYIVEIVRTRKHSLQIQDCRTLFYLFISDHASSLDPFISHTLLQQELTLVFWFSNLRTFENILVLEITLATEDNYYPPFLVFLEHRPLGSLHLLSKQEKQIIKNALFTSIPPMHCSTVDIFIFYFCVCVAFLCCPV